MKTVLFVDDESILLDLYRMFFASLSHEWKAFLCSNPTEAANILKNNTIDIIVSDFNMPGMNGAQLLEQVRNEFPWVVRVILTAGAERTENLLAARFAHRCLIKPLKISDLASELENIYLLFKSDISRIVRTTITGVDTLPAMPKTIADLLQELGRGRETSMKTVGELIARDPGMSANILKILGSKFFSSRLPVFKIEHAVNMLGLNLVKNILVSAKTLECFPLSAENNAFAENIIEHSVICADFMAGIFTAEMKNSNATPDEVDIAEAIGMLHETGKLILASLFPDLYRKVTAISYTCDESFTSLEKHFLGVTHAEVAAYLFSLWGLPSAIPRTIAQHSLLSDYPSDTDRFVKAIRYSIIAAEHITRGNPAALAEDAVLKSNPLWFDVVWRKFGETA